MAYPVSQIQTDTIVRQLGVWQDCAFKKQPTLKEFVLNAQSEGGESLKFRVGLDTNSNASSINPRATDLAVANNQKRTTATAEWKYFAVPVELFDVDKWINASSSPSRMINTITEEMDNARKSLDAAMAASFWQLATTDPNGFVGMQTAIPTANTTGTYCDISRVTNTNWQNNADTAGGVLDLDLMYAMLLSCQEGDATGEGPDSIWTTSSGVRYFNSKLTPIQRINSDTTANAGFKNLSFLGVPVKWDRNVPTVSSTTANLYFMNKSFMKSYYMKGVRFLKTEEVRTPRGLASSFFIVWAGCVFVTYPDAFGVMSGITS